MCGIVGIISKNNAKKYKNNIKKALKEINYRGPDDLNYYFDNNISFGYVRLAIRGLEKKYNQPIIFNDTISFANGEVYSINNNNVLKDDNDLKFLIKEIIKNKEKIYDYVDADFALCTYNKKTKKVILARDFYGVKPLYYSWINENDLAFASNIKALNILRDNASINEETIKDYLIFGYPINNKTFYKNVFEFPTKTILEFDIKNNTKKYYSYDNEYLKYTNEHFCIYDEMKKAVKDRLVSDRSIGAHLSGGYDSSLISYIAKDKLEYITAYNNKNDNDLKISNDISSDLKLNHTIIKLPEKIPYIKMINILNSPIMSPGAFVPYEVSRVASLYNKKVLLAGQGADELFLGYDRFKKINSIKNFDELIELLSNSDLNILNILFENINIKNYKINFKSNNFLYEAQNFYVHNFLGELLHIEDAMHMNFSIENRVPFLSLPVRKFIKEKGIYIGNDQNKDAIYNANLKLNSKALNRNIKENMNRDLLLELKKLDFDDFFKSKIFEKFNYGKFKQILCNIDKLNKKQLFIIWTIYNIYLWYKLNGFKEKIVVN